MNGRRTRRYVLLCAIFALLIPCIAWADCDPTTGNYVQNQAWTSLFSTKDTGTLSINNIANTNSAANGGLKFDPTTQLFTIDPTVPNPTGAVINPSTVGCFNSNYYKGMAHNFITGVLCQVQEVIADASFSIYCPLQFSMTKTVVALATIYLALYACALVLGLSTLKEGWTRMVKATLIMSFALSPQSFYNGLYTLSMNALNGFSQLMLEYSPPRDRFGRLVCSCPPNVANFPTLGAAQAAVTAGNKNACPTGCTQIQDCVDIRILPQSDPSATAATAASFGTFLTNPNVGDPSSPSGYQITPAESSPCGDGQAATNCVINCSSMGPAILEPALNITDCARQNGQTNPDGTPLTGDAATTMSGSPICAPVTRVAAPQGSIFDSYDVIFNELIGNDLNQSTIGYLIAFMLYAFGLSGAVGLFGIAALTMALVSFVRLFITFLTSILALSFVLMFTPVFVPFALFETTRPLFIGWASHIISYVLQPVLILAFLLVIETATGQEALERNMGMRNIHLAADSYSVLSGMPDMKGYLNFDAVLAAPKFDIIKNKQVAAGVSTVQNFASFPSNSNIAQLPYFDYFKRLSQVQSTFTSINSWGMLGLMNWTEDTLGDGAAGGYGAKLYLCGGLGSCTGSGHTSCNPGCAAQQDGTIPSNCKMNWSDCQWSNSWRGINSYVTFFAGDSNSVDAQLILAVDYTAKVVVPAISAGTLPKPTNPDGKYSGASPLNLRVFDMDTLTIHKAPTTSPNYCVSTTPRFTAAAAAAVVNMIGANPLTSPNPPSPNGIADLMTGTSQQQYLSGNSALANSCATGPGGAGTCSGGQTNNAAVTNPFYQQPFSVIVCPTFATICDECKNLTGGNMTQTVYSNPPTNCATLCGLTSTSSIPTNVVDCAVPGNIANKSAVPAGVDVTSAPPSNPQFTDPNSPGYIGPTLNGSPNTTVPSGPTQGCGPYGVAPNDCVIMIQKATDGTGFDVRDRMCQMAGVGDGVLQTANATFALAMMDGSSTALPSGAPPAVTPPPPPPGGKSNTLVPPADEDALTKIWGPMFGFAAAWFLLKMLTDAFIKKLPEIARELSSWKPASGGLSSPAPILGGESATYFETDQKGRATGSNLGDISPHGAQAGHSSFYTLGGAAANAGSSMFNLVKKATGLDPNSASKGAANRFFSSGNTTSKRGGAGGSFIKNASEKDSGGVGAGGGTPWSKSRGSGPKE